MATNTIITAADNPYFASLLTLISSIHKYSYDTVDRIVVYDLGLTEGQKDILLTLEKVDVKKVDILPFKEYIYPDGHAYKLFCLYDAANYTKNALWLDAGVCLLQDVKEIFDIIDLEDIFLVGDTHWTNKMFTKKKCIEIMNATEEELNDIQLSSGILGYKINGNFQQLINDAFEYSKIEGCVVGDEENHRHDQSVYSILASRYKCKKYDLDKYGYWTSIDRTLQTARACNAVIFVHRRGHQDTNDLKYKK